MTTFGIDFGTTNSVLATCTRGSIDVVSLGEPSADWSSLGFDKVLPSVIAMRPEGAVIGWNAKTFQGERLAAVKRMLATDDEVTITGTQVKVEEAGAMIFKHIQQRAEDAGLTLDRAVVTIPANSRGVARTRTKIAAGLAGIEVLALINEPTAAAMAYARKIGDREHVLVYDFGGGTLDVTILRSDGGVFIERASKGIQRLGGIDIDDALASYLKPQIPGSQSWDGVANQQFMLEVERAKIILSATNEHSLPLPDGSFRTVTRAELAEVARPLIEQSRAPIEQCLRDVGDDVRIDHVVLVGGSSKIPAVRSFLTEMLGVAPMEGVDPMTAIAEGAAFAAAILGDEVDDHDFFVATEHALGLIILNDEGTHEIFSVLIPRNNMLPADSHGSYVPVNDFQEIFNLRVVEGDPAKPLDHEDNVILREWSIQLAEPRPRDEAAFEITYKYDVDGILRVVVRDMKTNVVLMDDELAYSAERKRELGGMRRNVDRYMSGSQSDDAPASPSPAKGLDAESQALVDKVTTKIIPFIDEDEAAKLNGIIADLASSAPETIEECRRRLGAAMREHAYLL